MTQQEMEARIEKLERQVLFLANLATATSITLCIAQGEMPTKDDLEMSSALAKSLIKADITDKVVKELFT